MKSLRQLFRSSHAEIWRQLSTELGARYVAGGTWRGDRIEATHADWTVTLDHVTVLVGNIPITTTRFRAPYVNPDSFRFTIYRRSLGSDLAKWFGMQDVAVGHASFDHAFIIKGTDPRRLKLLFDDAELRHLLERQPDVSLLAKDDEGWFGQTYPPRTDLLECTLQGLVSDKPRLMDAFELLGVTLDHLRGIGSAEVGDPGVEL